MKLTDLFMAELEREVAATRNSVARVPEERNDWRPHEKSMRLGYLAALVATMPSWIEAIVKDDEIDFKAPDAYKTEEFASTRELIEAFDRSLEKARKALEGTT